jgi:ABC-type Zn uptake system ZnuABC Zn-binding protein ZnuA
MVATISDALIAADPDHADVYTANAGAYTAQLQELDTWIETEVAKIPEQNRKLVTSHDTFGYFADRYGFEVIGTALNSVTTEVGDPAAGEIADLVSEIEAAGVPAIFAENVHNTDLMESIASEAGVTLAPSLFTDALGDEDSGGATYLEMMRTNVGIIVTALSA